jgi:hypothetical protein
MYRYCNSNSEGIEYSDHIRLHSKHFFVVGMLSIFSDKNLFSLVTPHMWSVWRGWRGRIVQRCSPFYEYKGVDGNSSWHDGISKKRHA